ncbi:ferrous iron transport protein B [Solidesulfovibrio carbinoliphilus subsp. oakridgensis]|uniref:Ferrous iron transport protein B n=1 Tax=Solidesulfovibrio carbinoliphilus subsp. oakridgensis TaxID=694327 RepID=G7QDA5_9BACT|nr:ferrous iron transport protein B [Solidesulfovibrio carbinoliphilus]EHJ46411.1 ferrous iron transport protein B [Solidesulfovibrio carbinoliphilus subsp. oakridgensis]
MSPTFTFALAGNPNCGKTTLFNALTGARQHVANYPGVTVEKREGRCHAGNRDLTVVDLPGMYSLTAYSADERAARAFLVEEKPSCVIDVLDAGTLERGLYLAVQFLELGVPLVLAVNMMDEARRKGMVLHSGRLSRLLGVPVVETVARRGEGKDELVREALAFAEKRRGSWKPLHLSYGPDVDRTLLAMQARIEADRFLTDRFPARWLALKYIEGDEEVMGLGRASGPTADALEALAGRLARHIRETTGTYAEAVISDYRYGFIATLLRRGVLRRNGSPDRVALSDAVDRVLTHAVLGPAIMLAVLFGMFQLTFLASRYPMDWLEAGFAFFGDQAAAALPPGLFRSLLVSGVIAGVGGVLGFVPLICIMFFLLSCLEDLGYMARMAYMLDRLFRAFGLHGASVMPFIISGGIPGGCAVPGVMAARTLRSPRERLATILCAPFMACGAKIPVFFLLIAAFFPGHPGTVMFAITLASWAAALCVARLWRSTVIPGEATPFLMELPPYRLPTLRGLAIHTGERAWQYAKKAGTTILAISIIMWAAMTFPGLPADQAAGFEAERAALAREAAGLGSGPATEAAAKDLEARADALRNLEAEEALRHSLAGRLGVALEGVSRLAGFDWRINIALIGGLAAKEVVVSTMATAYALGDVSPEAPDALSEQLRADPAFSPATALALLAFTILYAPCFVTVAVMAREASWLWAGFAVVANTALGFAVAVAVYQLGKNL